MTRRPALFIASLLLLTPIAEGANWPDRPTLRAVRATTAPVIDGELSDPVWQSAPEFTDFTQHDPDDGKPATLPTSVRILYDDDAIYFAATMIDTGKPTSRLVRRDAFVPSDFLSINIDPNHDRTSGAAFTVTPADVQIDSILYNDISEDGSWDGVWTSAARIVPDGWVAEVRIPFSQLRFPDKPVHTWGINITRRTARNNEWVRIVNTPKGETGFVANFADLVGIEGIRRGKPLELVPYGVLRSDTLTRFPENELIDDSEVKASGGLDIKYALTSNLTLTGTINPDFGQVEVDPAVVNLSQFETFYPEKRPFFTEGSDIFNFGDSPARSHFGFTNAPRVFYSRRIGRFPQGFPDADVVGAVPDTTILGAAKLTGKLPSGWTIGILDAVTDEETVRLIRDGVHEREAVEPLSNYLVTRSTKAIGSGSRIGVFASAVNRELPENLDYLRDAAYTAGTDGYISFLNKAWIAEWSASGSRIEGSTESIAIAQRSSSRFYNRPDADHVDYDPSRTSLMGWAGRAMVSKQTGDWRPNIQVQAFSPGFDTNDVGFMQRTDMISAHALMQYSNQRPSAHFREKNTWFGYWNNSNFDGDVLEQGVFIDHFATLSSYWDYRASLFVSPEGLSDRLTRGGPVVRTEGSWSSDLSLGSDSRKVVSFSFDAHLEGGGDQSDFTGGGITLSARPRSNLSISISPYYSRSIDQNAYVTAFSDAAATATYGRRYVFADLDQRVFELGTRVDWTLTPRISLQLYAQPFVASGDYRSNHSLVAARTDDYEPYSGDAPDLDFNFRSVRASLVSRWEFRPGSAIYLVWNENRADEEAVGDFRFSRDLKALPTAPSHDVVLLKVSYWLPI